MDGPGFEAFVRDHQRMVLAIARSYVGDAAEDVAQEVFFKAFRKMDGVADPGRTVQPKPIPLIGQVAAQMVAVEPSSTTPERR